MSKPYDVPIVATGYGSTPRTFRTVVLRLQRLGVEFTTDANYFARKSSLLEETHIVRQSPIAPGLDEEEISTDYVYKTPGRFPLICLRHRLIYWPPNVWFTPHIGHELAHLLSPLDPADTDEYDKDFVLLDASCAQYLGFSRKAWEGWQETTSSDGGDWSAAKGYLPKGLKWPRFSPRHERQKEWAQTLRNKNAEEYASPRRLRGWWDVNGVNPILNRLFGYEANPFVELCNGMSTILGALHAKGGPCPFCGKDLAAKQISEAHAPHCPFLELVLPLLPFEPEGGKRAGFRSVSLFVYTGNA